MKKKLSTIYLLVCLGVMLSSNGYSQANTALSNLVSPTAANQSLLPGTDNLIDLGSASRSWRYIYLDSQMYVKGLLALHARGTGNFFTGSSAGNLTLTGSYTAGFGQLALSRLTTGTSNSAVGYGALASTTTGSYNVAVGSTSLFINTTGVNNTAIGFASLPVNTSGSYNTAGGWRVLNANTTGSNNAAFGYQAMYSNTSGRSNVAVGTKALFTNSGTSNLVAVGDSAMFSNSTGTANVAVGSKALYTNNTGTNNTALGYQSLNKSINGSWNTATGSTALYSNMFGDFNTANGYAALYANTRGEYNTAVGYNNLVANTEGDYNTSMGAQAMLRNTLGFANVAIGVSAMQENIEGDFNTAVGYLSSRFGPGGSNNAALGWGTLQINETGSENTAIGQQALLNLKTQNGNTAVGSRAGYTNIGSFNTCVGAYAEPNAAGYTNASSLGYQSHNTASNQVMLGSTTITSVRAAGSFVIYSDGRFKKDVKENVPGLAFIQSLRPVTYHYDIHGLNDKTGVKQTSTSNSKKTLENDPARLAMDESAVNSKEKILYTGFVAQEVEAAAKKINYDFSGVYKPENDKDVYGLSYSDFVVPLVKAVQELNEKNGILENQNAALLARLEKLESLLKVNSLASTKLTGTLLEQNIPNPFNGTTTIPYTLPDNFSKAQIVVTNTEGKVINRTTLNGKGKGNLNIDAKQLSAGTYQYSLFVDDSLVGSKQFLITK